MTVTALQPFTIGGSTIAAAAGIDPYLSPVALYLRMTGAIPEPEANGRTEWGKRLEPVILDALAQDGYGVAVYPAVTETDPARPWLVGHPDALGSDFAFYVIEAKATGGWAMRTWNGDEPPVTWQAQVQTYMHLTNTDRALIAALVDGTSLRTVWIDRNQRAIDLLLERGEAFYRCLCRGEVPPPDGGKATREALHALYDHGTPGRKVRASRQVRETVEEMRRLRAAMDATTEQYEARRRMIEATLGDAETLVDHADNVLVHWTTSARRSIDTERLKRELPAVHEQFTRETTTRRFTLA